MFFSRWIRQTVAATTLTSLVVPVSLLQAAESLPLQSDSPVQKEVAPAVKPIHFKLAQGGKMAGVIHDSHGTPVENQQVSIWFEGTEISSTVTDEFGEFGFAGLKPGKHIVASGEKGTTYKLWPQDAAPANSETVVQMTSDGNVVRGQTPRQNRRRGFGYALAQYPYLTTAAMIVGGIGVGYAIGYNARPLATAPPASPGCLALSLASSLLF